MVTFELHKDSNQDQRHMIMFKLDGELINIVWFDRANIDGDGYISLYLSNRYVSIVDVQNNQALNDELIKLAQ